MLPLLLSVYCCKFLNCCCSANANAAADAVALSLSDAFAALIMVALTRNAEGGISSRFPIDQLSKTEC